MAANQAAELTEDKDIIVLPTKTIPQGIVALVNYSSGLYCGWKIRKPCWQNSTV